MELRKLTDYYICYMDVLGYSELIKRLGEEMYLQIIDGAFSNVERHIKHHNNTTLTKFHYKIFSDNIVICAEKNSDHHSLSEYAPSAFMHISVLCHHLQSTLAYEHNIIIRGGLTEGKLYIDHSYVFGNGLIRAYELEDTIALFPRIVVDKIFEKTPIFKECTKFGLFKQDADGYYFLDYLNPKPKRPDYDFRMKVHMMMIERELGIHAAGSDRILQKYRWCKEYHNSTCHQYGFSEWIIE